MAMRDRRLTIQSRGMLFFFFIFFVFFFSWFFGGGEVWRIKLITGAQNPQGRLLCQKNRRDIPHDRYHEYEPQGRDCQPRTHMGVH